MIARGGKSIYGAPLGILMLEARFPRIPGDMGNGSTWPFPVLFRVVRGASPEKVVLNGATGLLQEALKWVSGGNEFRVNESKCVAVGDAICEFVIQKEPIA